MNKNEDFIYFRSLPEVSEVLSRLDLNSESVMDKSALNDFVNELDSSLSSTASRMSNCKCRLNNLSSRCHDGHITFG